MLVKESQLVQLAGKATWLIPDLVRYINDILPQYGMTSMQEVAHFLAQACHETDYFKTLTEYASGKAYEGRADLGNTQWGDGVKFKGRGIFQITGRSNYARVGVKKNQPTLFLDTPELLATPEIAVWAACEYWTDRGLSAAAISPDTALLPIKTKNGVIKVSPIEVISRKINGGINGLNHRIAFYETAKKLLAVEPQS